MGRLLTLKIEIAKIIQLIAANTDDDIEEYLRRRLSKLEHEYNAYGISLCFKVTTPLGIIYFTNITEPEIHELLDGKFKTTPTTIEEIEVGIIKRIT